jgi:hypothetical protein
MTELIIRTSTHVIEMKTSAEPVSTAPDSIQLIIQSRGALLVDTTITPNEAAKLANAFGYMADDARRI